MRSDRKRRGFSLVELMVVVTILGILAAIVLVNFSGSTIRARQSAAATQIASFQTAIGLYHTYHGKYPGGLDELTKADSKNNNKYYLKSIPKDPWGNGYKFEKTSDGYVVICRGADGASGGSGENADITSNNLEDFQ